MGPPVYRAATRNAWFSCADYELTHARARDVPRICDNARMNTQAIANSFRRARFPALLCAALLSTAASAQEAIFPQPPPSIRSSGDAVVTAKPDRAQIDIGVMSRATQSQDAATQNARQLEAVLAALRKLLGANADIRTISYNLTPNYHYPRDGGEPTVTGYTATNTVRVTLDDLTRVGAVIDAATKAGANQVQNIRFMLKDEQAVRAQALREATTKARAQAEAMASALGLKITRVLSVSDSGPVVPVINEMRMMAARAEAADVSTPVIPGQIEVRANVTLTVEVAGP